MIDDPNGDFNGGLSIPEWRKKYSGNKEEKQPEVTVVSIKLIGTVEISKRLADQLTGGELTLKAAAELLRQEGLLPPISGDP